MVCGSGQVSVLSSWRRLTIGDNRTSHQTSSCWSFQRHELQGNSDTTASVSAQTYRIDFLTCSICRVRTLWTLVAIVLHTIKCTNYLKTWICSNICNMICVGSFSGFQPQPVVSMPQYGSSEVITGSGVPFVGNSLAGDPGATSGGHWVTSCPTPVLPATTSTPALLEPAGWSVWWEKGKVNMSHIDSLFDENNNFLLYFSYVL